MATDESAEDFATQGIGIVAGAALVAAEFLVQGLQGAAAAMQILREASVFTEDDSRKRKRGPKKPRKPRGVSGFNVFLAETAKAVRDTRASQGEDHVKGESGVSIMAHAQELWAKMSEGDKSAWKAKAHQQNEMRQQDWSRAQENGLAAATAAAAAAAAAMAGSLDDPSAAAAAASMGPMVHSDEPAIKRSKTKKLHDPSAPKRPMSGFFLFRAERYPQCKAEHPDAGPTMISKLLGDEWAAMSEEQKAPWSHPASSAMAKYRDDKRQYEQTPEAKAFKKKLKTAKIRRRTLSGYNLFRRDVQPQLTGNYLFAEQAKQVAQMWAALSHDEREAWQQKARELKDMGE
eukprot:TRINITY_DN338_c0_g1_i2.p1 TRINITY_DN338_c0_g1~~TRINITY_DN338_c0_g1_i2.p1  ORF type:complete len:346 (-),score=69.99 TRINITY_DN338_c0_g1_i2:680-1717(-)